MSTHTYGIKEGGEGRKKPNQQTTQSLPKEKHAVEGEKKIKISPSAE